MRAWKKLAALSVVAVLAVFSVAACSLFMSDEEVINKMITTMATVESYSNDTNILGAMEVEGVPGLEFKVKMSGSGYTPKVIEGAETAAAFEYNLKGDVDAQGQTMSFDADMKLVDNAMYFKINSLPMIPMMDLSEITNKWIILDFSLLDEFNTAKTGVSSKTNFVDLMNYANDLYSESNIFLLKEDLGSDKVGKNRVYHFSVDMNKEALANMMINLVVKMAEGEEIDELELEQSKAEMLTAFETVNFKNLELFIDKSDFYLRRVLMEIDLADPESAQGAVSLVIDGVYDNFNKTVNVTAPEDAKSLDELMSALMGPMVLDPENEFNADEIDSVNLYGLNEEDQAMLDEFLLENPDIKLEE